MSQWHSHLYYHVFRAETVGAQGAVRSITTDMSDAVCSDVTVPVLALADRTFLVLLITVL